MLRSMVMRPCWSPSIGLKGASRPSATTPPGNALLSASDIVAPDPKKVAKLMEGRLLRPSEKTLDEELTSARRACKDGGEGSGCSAGGSVLRCKRRGVTRAAVGPSPLLRRAGSAAEVEGEVVASGEMVLANDRNKLPTVDAKPVEVPAVVAVGVAVVELATPARGVVSSVSALGVWLVVVTGGVDGGARRGMPSPSYQSAQRLAENLLQCI